MLEGVVIELVDALGQKGGLYNQYADCVDLCLQMTIFNCRGPKMYWSSLSYLFSREHAENAMSEPRSPAG